MKEDREDRIVRPKEVPTIVGICSRQADRLEAQGKFPKTIKLGQKARGRSYNEIQQWIAERKRERDMERFDL